MILFLSKKMIKENFYLEIYFFGVPTLVKVNKTFFDSCKFQPGQQVNIDLFEISYYKKGYDLCVNLKLK